MSIVHTTKTLTDFDSGQTLQTAFNDVDGSFTVDGFLTAVVGRSIGFTTTTTTVAGDTLVVAYTENGLALYTFTLVFTSAAQTTLISATRTA